METRNLIKFGKNSYVVTLPSSWIKQNKLEKGDKVFVNASNTGLIISPSIELKSEEKKTIISIDGKDDSYVFREIVTAYVDNSKIIEVRGVELKDRSKQISKSLQEFMSLEILDQTSDKIIVRNFLRDDDISIDEVITRIDNIVKVMLNDCINSFEEDFSASLKEREKAVNKFYFLLYRLVKGGLMNPSLGFKMEKLLDYYIIADSLENLGDDCKRISYWINSMKLKKEKKNEIIGILNKLDKLYRDSMKAYHNKDKINGYKSVSEVGSFIDWIDSEIKNVNDLKTVHFFYEIKNFLFHIKPIVRVVIQI